MRLVLVLPHRNEAELTALLKELYDPSSASYHKFLTVEEFTARFGPSQEDYDAAIRFAEANGLTVVGTSRNRMNLDVTGPVANVEAAFHLTMGTYQHPTGNRTFFAPDREPTPSSCGTSQASTTIRPQHPRSCAAMRARRRPLSCAAMRAF
jgi:xanthomonalisin